MKNLKISRIKVTVKGERSMIDFIRVSAQNSTEFAKQNSDYICTVGIKQPLPGFQATAYVELMSRGNKAAYCFRPHSAITLPW